MFHAVKGTLAEMTSLCGRDTEKDLFGKPGGYKTILSKNTVEKPAPSAARKYKGRLHGRYGLLVPGCQPLIE